MTRQEEFEKKLEELKALYEAEMQEQSDALNEYEYKDEWPKNGDKYWFIDSYGYIYGQSVLSSGAEPMHVKTGNIFRTREEAEYHLRMIDLAWEIKQLSFEPDYSLSFQCIYRFDWDRGGQEVVVDDAYYYVHSGVHFKTEKIAKQARDLIKSNDDFLYMLRRNLI